MEGGPATLILDESQPSAFSIGPDQNSFYPCSVHLPEYPQLQLDLPNHLLTQ